MSTTLDNIQRRLASLGYSPGELDGVPGRRTLAAVKAFQKRRGLRSTASLGRSQ